MCFYIKNDPHPENSGSGPGKSGKIRKNRLRPVLLYCGRTRAPTDMVGVSTDRAWPEDYAGAIKNPDFRIRTELEPENRFSRWYLYHIVQRGAGASQKAAWRVHWDIMDFISGTFTNHVSIQPIIELEKCFWSKLVYFDVMNQNLTLYFDLGILTPDILF